MDWQIRIALIVFGVALVAYIYFDYAKKKKTQKENARLKKQFSKVSTGVDSSGFDSDGVGLARSKDGKDGVLNNKIEPSIGNIEPKIVNTSHSRIEEVDKTKEFEQRVYSLIIQAPKGSHYKGSDFMPLFLSQGLKFGEMNIFHRYKSVGKNPGKPIYSIANAVEPGTFDLNSIDSFRTPAFAIFSNFAGEKEFASHYGNLVKTADFFVKELGGSLLDESQQVYSKQAHNERLEEIKNSLNS